MNLVPTPQPRARRSDRIRPGGRDRLGTAGRRRPTEHTRYFGTHGRRDLREATRRHPCHRRQGDLRPRCRRRLHDRGEGRSRPGRDGVPQDCPRQPAVGRPARRHSTDRLGRSRPAPVRRRAARGSRPRRRVRTPLPLLVQYSGQARAVRSALPEGTEVKRELPLVDAVAIGQERSQAGDLWWSRTNSPRAKRGTGLAGTVKKGWLDGGIKPNLDRSVPQIGAPAAGTIGATGKGVKVAILDSGYDATHPDLNGRVIATKGFTDDDDVVARIGHGTHVASTVAGSGAASGGRYRGVAPDADLLIGKVCGDRNCELSDIIEGMQWAASEGARVANLSIGGGPTDGTDIVAQAVNELTASSGTLFVASPGSPTSRRRATISSRRGRPAYRSIRSPSTRRTPSCPVLRWPLRG
ncbi:S8 family serine peptidase [Kribbella qitaiheensis]|uniref:S8 family serine peptidase n=1 Tax=Kribbella qitaiheensis TaxID=1544730 RepID=A0A7G6WUW8_9ACTN|nr:S8 family serine peptidase [Kribbella qitaiheensis]